MVRNFAYCVFLLLSLIQSACQRSAEEVPLNSSLFSLTDKFFDVQAISEDKAIVIGYGGKILVTLDGGRTWKSKQSGTDVALYSIAFPDPRNGWISGQDGALLHTTDGGSTWNRQESGMVDSIFGVTFVDTNHGWAAGDRATFLKTLDGGENWELGYIQPSLEGVGADATLALVDPIFYDIEFLEKDRGWITGEFGKIYRTVDGGESWVEQQNSLLGQSGITDALNLPTFFGISFSDSQNGVVSGLEGKVAVTSDGGETWKFVNAGTANGREASLFATEPLYASCLIGNTGWMVGAAGRVLRLEGGNWKQWQVGVPVATWLRSVDFFDDRTGWIVGGYGIVLRTIDGGENWFRVFG